MTNNSKISAKTFNEETQVNDDIQQIPSTTPNLQTELARQLQELVPEAIADGKVDVEKLRELLAEDAGDPNERFGLFWPGKKRALRAAQSPTTATLRPDRENSKDWDTTKNVFIEGDNLEVLKILQKHYHGKIKMIYIDPPYNTGKDFIYPDNFKEGLETYLEWTKQVNEEGKKVSTNSESEGRYHSNWLNMMYPRLKLARNLLTDDGVIFISIDDHEYGQLKKLLDEIYGESNFIGNFITKRAGGRQDSRHVANVTEYILCYSKKINDATLGVMQKTDEVFPKTDVLSGRKYKTQLLRKWGANSRREDRPNLFYPIIAPDGREVFPMTDNGEGCWRWSENRMAEEISSGNVEFVLDEASGNWKTYEKLYEGERSTKKFTTLFDDINVATASKILKELTGGDYFDYPKSIELIKRLVSIGADPDSIILDFFSGSGTTAHAVMQSNAEDGGHRRYIQVQLPEPTLEESEARKAGFNTIADIARKRVILAAEKIQTDLMTMLDTRDRQLDTGFRSFKLTDTSFSKWRVASDININALEKHLLDLRESSDDAATPEDLLTELLLKQGYSLTEDIAEVEIAGVKLHSVGGGLLLAYLDEHVKPTLEQVRAFVDADPQRFIILEDAFQGDDELKTNLVQLCRSKGVELWTA